MIAANGAGKLAGQDRQEPAGHRSALPEQFSNEDADWILFGVGGFDEVPGDPLASPLQDEESVAGESPYWATWSVL